MSGVKRVGIIGGGAAGLFTACQLKRLSGGKDIDITVIEKNSVPGKKLILTGHGRCNITNLKDPSVLKKGYHEAENFIYPALREFGPEDTVRFFEDELGLKTKEEENNRIFPACDSAVKVRDEILSYLSDTVKIVCDANVLGITKQSDFELITEKGIYNFDVVVLSCGGSSFIRTGSSGDSYRFAGLMGHTIIPLRAALAPVRAAGCSLKFTSALSGVSVNAKISLYCNERITTSSEGEMLFAESGLTGPAVMELSREIPADISGENAYMELDLVPSMNDGQFEQEFLALIRDHADTKITTLISRYIPASAAYEITSLIDAEDLYAQGFTKENRKKLCRTIKHLKIVLDNVQDFDRAYVTRGGVSLKEIERKTMQSKIVSGLYITGEALDIDGISGGYNLQACMSEAYLAAKDILT